MKKHCTSMILYLILFSVVNAQTVKPEQPNEIPIKKLESISKKQQIKTDKPKLVTPSYLGVAAAIFPGILLNGSGHFISGHKEGGYDLLKLQGVSLLAFITGSVVLIGSGASGFLAPVYIPLLSMSSMFLATGIILDILGCAGIANYTEKSEHPYKEEYIELSYINQNDTYSDLYNFSKIQAQFTAADFFFKIGFLMELNRKYQEFNLLSGYHLRQNKNWNIYALHEIRYERSYEGFSISTTNLLLETEYHLGSIYKTFRFLYLQNSIGYGRQWFHFFETIDYSEDFASSNLIVTHRLRFQISEYFEIASAYLHRHDTLLVGAGFVLGTFEHFIKFKLKRWYLKTVLEHGTGHRIFISSGYRI
ncbi:MAG: hypothetical protein OEZ13_07440 [Spirochaetia bacterium]|nr:hypothetical protein [Spirochaetia bacterium]